LCGAHAPEAQGASFLAAVAENTENIFSGPGAPHFGHCFGLSARERRSTSKVRPHFPHWYSCMGILFPKIILQQKQLHDPFVIRPGASLHLWPVATRYE